MSRLLFSPPGLLALRADAYGIEHAAPPRLKAELWATQSAVAPEAVESPQPKVGIMQVRGPLVQHWPQYDPRNPGPMPQSYAEILQTFGCFLSMGVQRVVVAYDTPGGLVAGCFQTARALRQMADAAGIEYYAYVEGDACSAGYALAAPAHRVYCCDTAQLGSIGVIAALREETQADAKLGLRYTIITSGARKADGNPHVAVSEDALSAAQNHVDAVADLFFNHVAEYRAALSYDAIKALEAGVFLGARAQSLGFVDGVLDFPQFMSLVTATESPIEKEKNTMKLRASKGFTAAVDALKAVGEDKDASDVEKSAAKKMLAAIEAANDDEDGDGDTDKDTDKDKAKAESSDAEDDKAKAAAAPPAPAAAATPPAPAAAVVTPADVLAEVRAMLATQQRTQVRDERKSKRATLLAARPDIPAGERMLLAKSSLETVEEWLRTHPVAAAPVTAALAATTAGPTQGAQAPTTPQTEALPVGLNAGELAKLSHLDERYGLAARAKRPSVFTVDAGSGMQAQVFSVLGDVGVHKTITQYKTAEDLR